MGMDNARAANLGRPNQLCLIASRRERAAGDVCTPTSSRTRVFGADPQRSAQAVRSTALDGATGSLSLLLEAGTGMLHERLACDWVRRGRRA